MRSEPFDEYDARAAATDAALDAVPDAVADAATDTADQARETRMSHVTQFGLRAAALAGMVAPVAMVVGGIADGVLGIGGSSIIYTTCCPLRT